MNHSLESDGYGVATGFLSPTEVQDAQLQIQKNLLLCAQEMGCQLNEYLTVISRWVAPTKALQDISILDKLSIRVEEIVQRPVILKKVNLICKNAHCHGSIPFHQDVAYSHTDPYEFTTWIALDAVTMDSSPLEVVPKSHLEAVSPAVDFWSPEYQPNKALEENAHPIPVQAGDAIFFDSRLWHGSGENRVRTSRYALVMRWKSVDWTPSYLIPPPEPLFFGMWSCGEEAEARLRHKLGIQTGDFLTVIDAWLEKGKLEAEAKNALKHLRLLHRSSQKHRGGDATGTVYQNLWRRLLQKL